MYCRCNVEEGDGEDPTDVQCFVTAEFAADDAFLKIFEGRASVESLGFTTYASGTHKMDFVPSDTLSRMPGLEKLKFSQMNLGVLRKQAFYNLSRLAVLSLDSNEITDLDKEAVSHLPKLRKLELADNNLTTLSAGVLTELPSLTHLYLEKNQIATLEDLAFVHLSSLSELDLSDNVIENLTEGTFKGLGQLTRLDLFRNKVRRLGARVFGGAPMLVELDLKYNSIDEVDPLAFDGLPQLAILYLSYNRLRVLPANMFLGAPNLMTVDLSQNKLVTLTWRTLQDLVNVDAPSFDLSLTGNQFSCDCRIAWMLHLENATRSDKFRRELRHVKCDFDGTDAAPTARPGSGSSHDYGDVDDDDGAASVAAGKLDNVGSTTDIGQGIAELIPTVALPAADTQGEKEAPVKDFSGNDHASKNDIDTVLSQQKALEKSEPPRKAKPRPEGVNSGAFSDIQGPGCVGIMVTSLVALAMSMDR
ncbi:hypothetical protein MTO96_003788 [Rhipicephalus appendiculatus]